MLKNNLTLQETLQHIKELPLNDSSQMFGLHDNANVTYAQNEAFKLLASLLLLQPKETAVGSLSREEVGVCLKMVRIQR